LNYSVLVISLKSKYEKDLLFQNLQVEISEHKRLFVKWIEFYKKVKKIISELDFEIFIGSDLYSLTNVFNISKNCISIYDSREIYSSLASLNNRKLSQFIITSIEKFCLKKVNKIIVSGELDRDYLLKKKGFQKDFFIIKNLPPTQIDSNSNYLREKYNISQNYKVAIYQGAILHHRGIFPFLEAMKYYENIFFVMIGENQIELKLNQYIEANGLGDRCKIHPPVDYTELLEITKSADFGISLFEPVSDSYQYALPNKIFEYLSSGIPYLATNLPAIKLLTEQTKAGILIDNLNDINELEEKIKFIINDDNYKRLKMNAIANKNNYTYNTQINEIKRLVNNV